MPEPAHRGPAGFISALGHLQEDIASTCRRFSVSGPKLAAFKMHSPYRALSVSKLALTLRRQMLAAGSESASQQFIAICKGDRGAWDAFVRAPTSAYRPESWPQRLHHLTNLEANCAHHLTLVLASDSQKLQIIYAAVLAGLGAFERAHHVLSELDKAIFDGSDMQAMLCFVEMLRGPFYYDQAYVRASLSVFGHFAGAPRLAWMALAYHYEQVKRRELATVCFILAATRPETTALDNTFIFGAGHQFVRLLRGRAQHAQWLDLVSL